MSGNEESIDLNSDVALGDRGLDSHGFNLPVPVTDVLIEQRKAERPWKDLGEDEVNDAQGTNSSLEGLCRLDKDVGDSNAGFEAVNNEFMEGISSDNVEVAEIRCAVTDAGVKIGDEPSIVSTDFSGEEREFSERMDVSEKIPAVCGDEIMELEHGAGTLDASSSDAVFCSGVKKQVAGRLGSLKELAEGGVADATNGRHSFNIHPDVISREGIRRMPYEDGKVAQDGELTFDSVDVKCNQFEKHNHGDGIDTLTHDNDVHDSGSLHDNSESNVPISADYTRQLTNNISQKAGKLMESNELLPVVVIDMTKNPALEGSENQSRKVNSGQTDENEATGCYFTKTETSMDIDEANLFDVVIEMDPNAVMEEDVFDEVNANSADSVVEFKISDLVWGKVRSHPWWPGQICDPSASSKKALKYFKEDRYLVAFFGDQTFAWKDASMLKPFQEYFPQFQKQTNSENFDHAIDCVLEEFSRRVEFGLACSCLSDEIHSKLQMQTLTNAGIRKKSSRIFGGDGSLSASSFDPVKLINIVKEIARLPRGEVDELELVQSQAQLLAFNRWKGYYELPEFSIHDVVLNNADHHLAVDNDFQTELIDLAIDFKDDEVALDGKGDLKTQDSPSSKRKRNSGNRTFPSKKGKKLSDLMSEKFQHIVGRKLNLHASSVEHQVVDDVCIDPFVKPSITHVSTHSANESGHTNQTLRVGDRIRRVACILNKSSPIFKPDDGISHKTVAKNEGNEENTQMPSREILNVEYPLHEVFSQLCLAAIYPLEGFGLQNTIVNFFSEFRNSICMDPTNLWKQETGEVASCGKAGNELTMTGETKEVSASAEASESEFIKDSYWTDRLIQGVAEDQPSLENQNGTVEFQIQTPSETVIPTEQAVLPCPDMNCSNLEPHELPESESLSLPDDVYPTALILNFTDLDSVPSETNLNNIFRKYGALYESKTEVMKKSSRAKVVFKRSCDAETAFSSAGKYSIFGPSLVSYRLKYLPPPKVSPAKRRRKEMKSQEENTT